MSKKISQKTRNSLEFHVTLGIIAMLVLTIMILPVSASKSDDKLTVAAPTLFNCKSGSGYTLFDQNYANTFQVCPAHDKNYGKTGRKSSGPLYIVIHNTAGGSTQSNIDGFQSSTKRASANYLVGPDTNEVIRVVQMVSENYNAWHADANRRSLNGKNIDSTNSVGIEIVGHSGDPNWPSIEIYNTVAALVQDIVERNKAAGREVELSRNYILGHEEINSAGKWDPGPKWDWKYFMETSLGGTYEPSFNLVYSKWLRFLHF